MCVRLTILVFVDLESSVVRVLISSFGLWEALAIDSRCKLRDGLYRGGEQTTAKS